MKPFSTERGDFRAGEVGAGGELVSPETSGELGVAQGVVEDPQWVIGFVWTSCVEA